MPGWSWQKILLFFFGSVVAVYLLEPLVQRAWVRLRPGATLVLAIDAAHPFDAAIAPAEAERQTLAVLRNRIERVSSSALVAVHGNRVEVVLPRGESAEQMQHLLTRTGRLELKIVDDGSDYMKALAGLVKRDHPDGVDIGGDSWSEKESGAQHVDIYLRAPDALALARACAATTKELPLPSDHEIASEESAGDAHSWRTYYLYRRAELTGDHINEAELSWDPQSNRPEVSLVFDSEGAKTFEALTARTVGRKLAILLEGRVTSAPVIEGKIAGGRARITCGGSPDPYVLQQEAKDLVAVLQSGGAAAPVNLVEVRPPR